MSGRRGTRAKAPARCLKCGGQITDRHFLRERKGDTHVVCPLELFVNSASDFSIVDGAGNRVSLDEARGLFLAGKVSNFNLAFGRLARQFDFDIDRLKLHYQTGGRP